MKYKTGDIVIKTTGGNRMTVVESQADGYKCLWFVENSYHESKFQEHEILTILEWKRSLKTEEREDKINQMLG